MRKILIVGIFLQWFCFRLMHRDPILTWDLALAGSVGFLFVSNQTSLPMEMYKSKDGFAGDVSVAVDLGKGNHGCLIGLKYFGAINTLETSGADQNSSGLCVFVKYAYRHKVRT